MILNEIQITKNIKLQINKLNSCRNYKQIKLNENRLKFYSRSNFSFQQLFINDNLNLDGNRKLKYTSIRHIRKQDLKEIQNDLLFLLEKLGTFFPTILQLQPFKDKHNLSQSQLRYILKRLRKERAYSNQSTNSLSDIRSIRKEIRQKLEKYYINQHFDSIQPEINYMLREIILHFENSLNISSDMLRELVKSEIDLYTFKKNYANSKNIISTYVDSHLDLSPLEITHQLESKVKIKRKQLYILICRELNRKYSKKLTNIQREFIKNHYLKNSEKTFTELSDEIITLLATTQNSLLNNHKFPRKVIISVLESEYRKQNRIKLSLIQIETIKKLLKKNCNEPIEKKIQLIRETYPEIEIPKFQIQIMISNLMKSLKQKNNDKIHKLRTKLKMEEKIKLDTNSKSLAKNVNKFKNNEDMKYDKQISTKNNSLHPLIRDKIYQTLLEIQQRLNHSKYSFQFNINDDFISALILLHASSKLNYDSEEAIQSNQIESVVDINPILSINIYSKVEFLTLIDQLETKSKISRNQIHQSIRQELMKIIRKQIPSSIRDDIKNFTRDYQFKYLNEFQTHASTKDITDAIIETNKIQLPRRLIYSFVLDYSRKRKSSINDQVKVVNMKIYKTAIKV